MALNALILAVAVSAAPQADHGRVAPRFEVTVARADVLLGDVMDVSRLPAVLRTGAAALPIARFGPGQHRITFTSSRLSERARALMPALSPWLEDSPAMLIFVERTSRDPASSERVAGPRAPRCMKLGRALGVGDTPTAHDLSPVPCGETAGVAAFRYDATARSLRARRELRSGEILAAVPAPSIPGVAPGQRVWLRSSIGPVRIEREVVALQPAGPGQSLFVQSAGGEVFSVSFADITP